MSLDVILAFIFITSISLGHALEDCHEASCLAASDAGQAFMQRKKEAHRALTSRARRTETLSLITTDLERIVDTKGSVGLSPNEVDHIATIKRLVLESIMPSIIQGAEAHRAEVAELHEAVRNCAINSAIGMNASDALYDRMQLLREQHKECREKEDRIMKGQDEACNQLSRTMQSITQTGDLAFPSEEADHDEVISYLKQMDQLFCGRSEVFKKEWTNCENLTDEYTEIHNECVDLQEELEETWCSWKADLDATCVSLAQCWETHVSNYNTRTSDIAALSEERKHELIGAYKVQCLWDAWEWENEPCTVNKTKLRDCYGPTSDTSMVEVAIPGLPDQPDCNSYPATVHPCTQEYLASEYRALNVSQVLIDEMQDACQACPAEVDFATEVFFPGDDPDNEDPEPPSPVNTTNVERAGDNYLKTEGEPDNCDGVIQTVDPVATGISVSLLQESGVVQVSMMHPISGTEHVMKLENGVAHVGDEVVTNYGSNDVMKIASEGDAEMVYYKNGVPFHRESGHMPPCGGHAKVIVCTLGISVKVEPQISSSWQEVELGAK
mmetsp:Transcript_45440/g.105403  ORF Transcript_45440/g.105403 Transcript_45440/m.105403 type:complete len:555 (+) Transcript_45440:54-1718(+)